MRQQISDSNVICVAGKGTPVYIYNKQIVAERAIEMRRVFQGYKLYYSVKANPHPEICSTLAERGFQAEVVSPGELQIALNAGFAAKEILFAGPGKSREDINFAIENGVGLFTVESILQAELIESVAAIYKVQVNVLLRVKDSRLHQNIGESMVSPESQFGLDVDSFLDGMSTLRSLRYIRIIGTQCYSCSQVLDPSRLALSVSHQIKLTRLLEKDLGTKLDTLDIGGGFGVPYRTIDKKLDLERCAALVGMAIGEQYNPSNILVETGRYVTAPAGVFVCRIVDVKQSMGRAFIICDGGFSGFSRPVLVGPVHKIHHIPLKPREKTKKYPKREYIVCGSSCSSIDVLGKGFFESPQVDDLIKISHAGAYGYSMSIHSFHSRRPPREVVFDNIHGDFG